ncbi:alpha/beta hydrolase [Draconibacterium mangrovi]|uniref:alpha/beta hydrolase n=1 Tax=Draconibacterium mangrovi TaxID=2697469 RepID=UPI0013D17D45|nr:alpha/beta hydrolase-fold protein [Draconibacterium mangrovi]
MKTKVLILILLSLFLLPACQEEYEAPDTDAFLPEKAATAGEGTIVTEMMHVKALEGNLLGDPADRMIRVYLPKSYYTCPEKHFPVIYFLHGTPAWGGMLMEPEPYEFFYLSAQLPARVDFPEEGFLPWLNNLVDNEGMKEAIIVMPDAQTKYGPSLYVNSTVEGNYEDYIVNELVSFIDQKYRTIPHFNWRAISGHCAGAIGSLNIAMKHPKVFRYVGALSPSHFPEPLILYMANFLAVEDEMWGVEGPLAYDPFAPFTFVNNGAVMLAQAWLPNPDNPPYYCDLPFEFVNGEAVIIPELMQKISEQGLLSMVQKNRIGLKQLKEVYFDCGVNDNFYIEANTMMHEQLDAMHIKHQFETYDNPGTHISNLYDRLGKAWILLSNDFPDHE